MKHRILAVAAILATAFAFAQPTSASAPAQDGEFYRTTGTAPIRSTAGTRSGRPPQPVKWVVKWVEPRRAL